MPSETLRVGIVGATGLAGQQFIAALRGHPTFEIAALAASSRSAGKTYRDALRAESGALQWFANVPLPDTVAAMTVQDAEAFDARTVDVVFTAVEAGPAKALEPRYAQTTPVLSTASAFRYDDDVPLILPGINWDHVPLLRIQQRRRGWNGFILPNPNCTTVGLAYSLAPLARAFGVARVHMVSMQSVSGAGRSPGVIGLDILDNLVPYIPKEEQKVQTETGKILGVYDEGRGGIVAAPFPVSCTCTRVGVLEGHTEVVHVELVGRPSEAEVVAAMRAFGADLPRYPSAPPALIHVHDDPFRPQPRLDRDLNDGMTTVVGRVRADETLPGGFKYVLVSHNTKMGAAKGCLLVAEHLQATGVIARA